MDSSTIGTIIVGAIGAGSVIWSGRQSRKAQRVAVDATSDLEAKKLDYSIFKDAHEANQKVLGRLEKELERTRAELERSHDDSHELRGEIRDLEALIDEYRERTRRLEDELAKVKRTLREHGMEID